MEILKNSRHERFCQLVACGGEKTESFCQVYPRARNWMPKRRCNRASEMATKLANRIRELQEIPVKETIAARTELAEYFTRVIRTPIGYVKPTSDLAQEFREVAMPGGGSMIQVKMPSKLEACEKLAKLMGYFEPEKREEKFHFKVDKAVWDALAPGAKSSGEGPKMLGAVAKDNEP